MQLSVRTLQRASFVTRNGIPELVHMVQAGELGLGPAEDIAKLRIEWQQTVVADGVDTVRRMAAQVRNLKNKPSDPYTEVFEIWKRASDAERGEIVELIRRLAAKLPKEDLDPGGVGCSKNERRDESILCTFPLERVS